MGAQDVQPFNSQPAITFLNLGNATASDRGVFRQLGKALAVNLNSVAATSLFTTPAAGITRCLVEKITLDNTNGTPTTNAVSFGASATPTDYLASVVIAAGVVAGKAAYYYPATNVAFAVYGVGISFVVNVTAGGAAITGDFTAWGYYE